MMKKLKGKGSTAPLWRNVPEDRRESLYRTLEYLALRGFHAETIARVCGCTRSQLYLGLQKLRIRLRDYRDGKTEPAKMIMNVNTVVSAKFRKVN